MAQKTNDNSTADENTFDDNNQSQYNHTDDNTSMDNSNDDEIPVLNLNDAVESVIDEKRDDRTTDDDDTADTGKATHSSNHTSDTKNHDQTSLLADQLEAERAKSDQYEQKLKLALADYQNLTKRTASEIDNGITAKMGGIMTDIVAIRDDFARARDTFAKDGADTAGLDSIMKNLDSTLQKYDVNPIDALGEIFDPDMHEAVSTEVDSTLDENTIIKELRRGYMLKNTIIRPTMVVISKKE